MTIEVRLNRAQVEAGAELMVSGNRTGPFQSRGTTVSLTNQKRYMYVKFPDGNKVYLPTVIGKNVGQGGFIQPNRFLIWECEPGETFIQDAVSYRGC